MTGANLYFRPAVRKLLDELKDRAPEVHDLARDLMPVVRYAPEILRRDHALGAMARADGVFAIDGSDFELFRWVFLHELGHNVLSARGHDSTEQAANAFADATIRRLVDIDPMPDSECTAKID